MHIRTQVFRFALSLTSLTVTTAATSMAQKAIVTTGSDADSAPVVGIEVGNTAPSFSAMWADQASIGPADQPFTSQQIAGKPVVLAFYPKDFTSGCTAQMTTFTEQYAELFGPDVVVLGISADSLETHKRFAESLNLPFKLLSDPEQRMAETYGSKGDGGYNKRTVFVIDRAGKIVYRDMEFGAVDPTAYDNLKVAVEQAKKK